MNYAIQAHLRGGEKRLVHFTNSRDDAEAWIMRQVDRDINAGKMSAYSILKRISSPARGNTNGVA